MDFDDRWTEGEEAFRLAGGQTIDSRGAPTGLSGVRVLTVNVAVYWAEIAPTEVKRRGVITFICWAKQRRQTKRIVEGNEAIEEL